MPAAAERPTAALDTSMAVAALLRSHDAHRRVQAFLRAHRPCLTAQSLAETYSVLTRLPGDARLSAADAATLVDERFPSVVALSTATSRSVHRQLALLGISGGAVYDALVALAAVQADLPLATRDRRAAATYTALGCRVLFA